MYAVTLFYLTLESISNAGRVGGRGRSRGEPVTGQVAGAGRPRYLSLIGMSKSRVGKCIAWHLPCRGNRLR